MTSEKSPAINPRDYFEGKYTELGNLALYAKASDKTPVVVLVDGNSPWATATKVLLSAISIQSDALGNDGFLSGCGDWRICEIAAKSAPSIAVHLLAPPPEPSKVKIIMFYQNPNGLRIACTDLSL